MYSSEVFGPEVYYDVFYALVNQQKQARVGYSRYSLYFVLMTGRSWGLWYDVDGETPVKRGHVTSYQIDTWQITNFLESERKHLQFQKLFIY